MSGTVVSLEKPDESIKMPFGQAQADLRAGGNVAMPTPERGPKKFQEIPSGACRIQENIFCVRGSVSDPAVGASYSAPPYLLAGGEEAGFPVHKN